MSQPYKQSIQYQDDLWRKWPRAEDWPAVLDIYKSAAYIRASYSYVWDNCQLDRDGRAALPHKRIAQDTESARRTLTVSDKWADAMPRKPLQG